MNDIVKYFLFGGWNHTQGGGHDFLGAYDDMASAMLAVRQEKHMREIIEDARLLAWIHLAEFDGESMRVTYWLNIPGTERDETDELEWVRYE